MSKQSTKSPGEIPGLNKEKSICKVGNVELKINDTIDYKSAIESPTSMGKILEFKYAGLNQSDTESVWMNIQDMADTNNKTEWISVHVWYEQYKLTSVKPVKDGSKKRSTSSEHPF
jgi:hypothetical protein